MKLPSITVLIVGKKVLLITLGTAVVLLVLALGMVYQVKQERLQRTQAVAVAEKQAQAGREQKVRETALQDQVKTLQASNAGLTTDKQTLCAYTKPSLLARTARATAHCQ